MASRDIIDISESPNPMKPDEVVPYKTLEDVAWFMNLAQKGELPDWIETPSKLTHTAKFCYDACDVNNVTPRKRYYRNSMPKTLLCHDYKGGYLDDRFVKKPNAMDIYNFTQWWTTDIFVYFSHNFVTIPPPVWISAAHKHGVCILGTLITEWNDGKRIWDRIFSNNDICEWFINALVLIVIKHRFDGYLLNVENTLEPDQVPKMINFIKTLREKLPKMCYLIWYDSVTTQGDLKWQNELNSLNNAFFEHCDGIFLNYNWTDDSLKRSLQLAGSKAHQVYVGIDVFGRGCLGGGGFGTVNAMKKVRHFNMSIALFAFGWTYESCPGNNLPGQNFTIISDRLFWNSLSPYFYIHGLNTACIETSFYSWVSLRLPNAQQELQPITLSTNNLSKDLQIQEVIDIIHKSTNESDKINNLYVLENLYKNLPPPPLETGFNSSKSCLKIHPNIGIKRYHRLFVLKMKVDSHVIIETTSSINPSWDFYLIFENSREQIICTEHADMVDYQANGSESFSKYAIRGKGTLIEIGLVVKFSTTTSFLYKLKVSPGMFASKTLTLSDANLFFKKECSLARRRPFLALLLIQG